MMERMPFSDDLSRRLIRVIADEQSEHRIPSLSAVYLRGGEVAWSGAVGRVDGRPTGAPATPDTQYRIGSITKIFVAVLVLRLVDDGLLGLDDRVDDHLRGTPVGRVTVVDLLSQRSGIRAETEGPWWERSAGSDWAALEPQLALRAEARGVFHYSNVGFAVLAEVVARLRGRAWHEVLAEEILAPLAMSRTTVRPQAPHAAGLAVHPHADVVLGEPEHDAAAMAPAGQLWSTATDLGRFATFLHAGDPSVLSGESLQLMRVPRSISDTPGQPWVAAYGFGLQIFNVDGTRQLGHGGSMPGFVATLRIDASSGDSVIIMANTTAGWTSDLSGRLFELVADHDPFPPQEWTADAAQAKLLELTGAWYWGPAELELVLAADGYVELRPRGKGRGSRFRPTGTDSWVGLDGYFLGEPLLVVRMGDQVSHADLASFRLTRTPYDPEADIPGGVDGTWS